LYRAWLAAAGTAKPSPPAFNSAGCERTGGDLNQGSDLMTLSMAEEVDDALSEGRNDRVFSQFIGGDLKG